jgi:Rrf2 family protein
VHIPAKVEYAMRALLALTALGGTATTDELANAQDLPPKFLGAILTDLRRAGILVSQRCASGGYRLARPPGAITVAEVMRVLDGPLAAIRGVSPEATHYDGAAATFPVCGWPCERACDTCSRT